MKFMNQYKVVFLDWDGTLCASRFWGQWATGEMAGAYQVIQNEFFAHHGDFIVRWMRGAESAETACSLLSGITGVSSEELLEGLAESCREMQFISIAIPSQIKQLRDKGVKVVLATDNMDTLSRWTLPALMLDGLVDEVLNSYALQALKRDISPLGESLFFAEYLKMHQILPGESLLIDDSGKNSIVESFGIDFEQVTKEKTATAILDSLLESDTIPL